MGVESITFVTDKLCFMQQGNTTVTGLTSKNDFLNEVLELFDTERDI